MVRKCKRIIDGTTYNTETATQIAGGTESDNSCENGAYLYQTRLGAFFTYSYQEAAESGSEKIEPLTPEQARSWLETYKNAGNNVDIFEALIAETPKTGASEIKYTLRMPESLRDRLAALAKANDQSLNAWMIRCLETCAAPEKNAS